MPVNYTIPDTLDDGNYSLNMTVADGAGNSYTEALGNFTIDSVAPLITINSPLSQSYDNATVLVNISSDFGPQLNRRSITDKFLINP